MHTQVEEINVPGFNPNTSTGATEAQCVSVQTRNEQCMRVSGDIVRVSFEVQVTTRINTGETRNSEFIPITKTLRVDRAGEQGMDLQCHVFPTCLFCFISERAANGGVTAVTCCVGILVLIKVEAEVQLLIPTYGYPAPPPEWRILR